LVVMDLVFHLVLGGQPRGSCVRDDLFESRAAFYTKGSCRAVGRGGRRDPLPPMGGYDGAGAGAGSATEETSRAAENREGEELQALPLRWLGAPSNHSLRSAGSSLTLSTEKSRPKRASHLPVLIASLFSLSILRSSASYGLKAPRAISGARLGVWRLGTHLPCQRVSAMRSTYSLGNRP
jgi:hypothetical protein